MSDQGRYGPRPDESEHRDHPTNPSWNRTFRRSQQDIERKRDDDARPDYGQGTPGQGSPWDRHPDDKE